MSTWHKISFLIVRFYYRISKFLWVYGMMCVWFFIYFMAVINTIYYCKTVKEMSFKLNHKKKFSLRGIQIAAERQGILLVPQGARVRPAYVAHSSSSSRERGRLSLNSGDMQLEHSIPRLELFFIGK